MNTKTGAAAAHSALKAYARRHGLPADSFRSDGGTTLTFDDEYRLQLRPASDGRLAVVAALVDTEPLSPGVLDEALLHMAASAAGMARDHPSSLAIDADSQRLVLQLLLPAATDVEQLETELAGFVNALVFWRQASAQALGRAVA